MPHQTHIELLFCENSLILNGFLAIDTLSVTFGDPTLAIDRTLSCNAIA